MIEGFGDDVIFVLFSFIVFFILILSWYSTHVRELPANLLIIERRFRRVYRHTNNQTQLIATAQRRYTSLDNNNNNGSIVTLTPTANHSPLTSNDIDIGEQVEQALVDEILDGEDTSLLVSDEVIQQEPSPLVSPSSSASSSQRSSFEEETTSSSLINNESIESPEATQFDNREALSCSSNDENSINILIRFVTENILKIQVQPNDTIGLIKKTHFNQELSSNQIVRFIYQGQFLKDTNTIKFYNIKDQTTIHCHITSRQPPNTTTPSASPQPPTDNSALNNNQLENSNNIQQDAIIRPVVVVDANTNNNQENNNNNNNTVQVLNIQFGSFLLPIFTILLASIWYFRMNFKQFFTTWSNLFLIFMTFVYTVFLFIHFYQMFTFTHRLTARTRRAVATN